MNYKEGRYVSKSGGIFMVSATFHVRTEILVIPGKEKSGAQQLPAPVDNGSNLDLIIDLVIVFQSTFIAGHKKKLKKKSFKNSKVQLKLQICVNNKCKSASEIKSIHALNNFKKIKTNKTSLGE